MQKLVVYYIFTNRCQLTKKDSREMIRKYIVITSDKNKKYHIQ